MGFFKEAILIVRQIQEKMPESNNNLYCPIVDLEKAFDRVRREQKWHVGE